MDGEAAAPGTIVSVRRVWEGTQTVQVQYTFAVTLDDAGYEDLRCVNRGPLLFSVPVGAQWVKKEYVRDGVERKTPWCDYLLYPMSRWGYAFADDRFSCRIPGALPADTPVFSPSNPPLTVRARMLPINWGTEPGYAFVCAGLPLDRTPAGEPETIEMIPYGCTDLRMTAMPLIRS